MAKDNEKNENTETSATVETFKKGKIAKTIAGEDSATFNFADGNSVTVRVADYPENVRNAATVAGFIMFLRNAYAGVDTLSEGRKAFDDKNKALLSGETSSRGSASNDFVLTMSRVHGKSEDECRERLAEFSTAELEEYKKTNLAKKFFKAQFDIVVAERKLAAAESVEKDDGELTF